MDTPRSPRQILADIWAEFRQARYEDEQEIIKYLAYLLTKDLPAIDHSLRIEKSRMRYRVDEEAVQRLLDEARSLFENRGGLATFFDRYILFYPTRIWRKDTYPIPRHIVEFMLALLQIETGHRFADFTCGQGGFLVNKGSQKGVYPGEAIGNEISEEMERLAHANVVLHGLQSVRFTLGNAFGVSAFTDKDTFDRIAMAPPFDGTVASQWVNRLFSDISERSNRLLFTHLALRQLKEGGQTTLLVSDGLLHNGGASRDLRAELVDHHAIKAIITLQAGMFQPYVATLMYILLFQKGPVAKPLPTWFIRLANDGYPLNVNRDLLAEPSQLSDLPLAQAAVLYGTDEPKSFQPLLDEQLDTEHIGHALLYKPLPTDRKGAILQIQPDAAVDSIHYLPVGKGENYLVIQARLHEEPIHTAIFFSNGELDISKNCTVLDLKKWKRTFFPSIWDDEELPNGSYVFGGGVAGQIIAITQEGMLLGFTKSREELIAADYSFSDIYWKQHAILPSEINDAAKMLQKIRENQSNINNQAESLQGQLAVKHLLTRSMTPELLAIEQNPFLALLGAKQRDIWDRIYQQVLPVGQTGATARHFQPEELFLNENLRDVQQTLQLLERLGLIVQVTLSDSKRYYRRVTELDLPETAAFKPTSSESE